MITKTYQIMTNQTCNLACNYCYETMNGKMNTVESALLFLETCLKRDKFTFGNGIVALDFIGGEPTLNPDILEASMDYLKNNGHKYGVQRITFGLSSNGTRLHTKRFIEIMEKFRGYLNIGISLDGKKEKHDKNRYTLNGNGSFDSALRGFNVSREILGESAVGIKSTFNVADIPIYAENVKYLMSLNPSYLYANFVFEEIIPKDLSPELTLQLIDCIDFYISNNYNFVFDHIITSDLINDKHMRNRHCKGVPASTYSKSGFCGAGTNMICLGFDNEIYGCNRFVTMGVLGTQTGILNSDATFSKVESKKMDLATNYKSFMHDHCKSCYLNSVCANCLAYPVEQGSESEEDFEKFYFEKRHCYFTKAKEIAKQYYLTKRYSNGQSIPNNL